jgi:hypothetical protein
MMRRTWEFGSWMMRRTWVFVTHTPLNLVSRLMEVKWEVVVLKPKVEDWLGMPEVEVVVLWG